jgi:hypothetical protein
VKVQRGSDSVLNTKASDTQEISPGLIDYLLFMTGTHPRNKALLRLDEPEIQIDKDTPTFKSVLLLKSSVSDPFSRLSGRLQIIIRPRS